MGGKARRRNAAVSRQSRAAARVRRSDKSGLPPGSLVHLGEKRPEAVRITYFDYDERSFREKQGVSVEECLEFQNTDTITWINIDGIDEISIIEKIGKAYDLHPLILEDIVTSGQRPKFENYNTYAYIVLRMLTYDDANQAVHSEQISIVLGPAYVISFQEDVGDIFDPIRDRIRFAKGRVRKMGADYLAYSLIDAIVDNYFGILEKIGERIEGLEDELIDDPTEDTLRKIHSLKREMMFLRRSVWPLRELVSGMQRDESPLIGSQTRIYLRDVYDHTIQVIDTIESFRDMASGMLEIYLSSLSYRMNAVMKVLTIIAMIFIPLTFIAGVYGMNFPNMPEIGWRFGYAAVLLLMLVVAAVMLVYFKRRKWL